VKIDQLGGSRMVGKMGGIYHPFFLNKFGNVKSFSYLCINKKIKTMHINKTILDLATLYTTLTIVETMEILEQVVGAREELEEVLCMLREDSTDIQERLEEIMRVEEQLEYVNMNIKTLENAILCHETKIFEKINILGKTAVICLN
jgi:hypothetical protein